MTLSQRGPPEQNRASVKRLGESMLPFVAGAVSVSATIWLLKWMLYRSSVPSLGDVHAFLATVAAIKWLGILFVDVLCALFIARALGGRWETLALRFVFVAMSIAVATAGVINVRSFSSIDKSEQYHLRAEKLPTLAELAVKMPDKFPASEVLVWLRSNAAGAKVAATLADLQSAGLASHRLTGIAQMDVVYRSNTRIVPNDTGAVFKRFHVAGAAKPFWIDVGQAVPGARLCVVSTAYAVLLVGIADAPGCESGS